LALGFRFCERKFLNYFQNLEIIGVFAKNNC